MGKTCLRILMVVLSAALASTANNANKGAEKQAASSRDFKAEPGSKAPADNLGYWLSRAKHAQTQIAAGENGKSPFAKPLGDTALHRTDALPGVLLLSSGKVLGGYLYTTGGRPWQVYEEKERRWRQVPFAAVLSITAIVTEEKMELMWRWKAMGVPERVYTGQAYPMRRYQWRFLLADGTEIIGTVKGQPIRIRLGEAEFGPFVLHERHRGTVGQRLQELVYVRKIIISRRLMRQVVKLLKAGHAESRPAERPPGRPGGSGK